MKIIYVSDKMYEALMQISKELVTQDPRGTAMPYFFQVQDKKEVSVGEGQGEEVWVYDENVISTSDTDTIREEICEYKGIESPEERAVFLKNLTDYETNSIMEGMGYHIAYRDFVDERTNVFFTEKGVKEHIKNNKHHYTEKVTDYVNYAFRNPEMELISQFLCELSGNNIKK